MEVVAVGEGDARRCHTPAAAILLEDVGAYGKKRSVHQFVGWRESTRDA